MKQVEEEVLEPDLPIIDAHHHMWFKPGLRDHLAKMGGWPDDSALFKRSRYLLEDFVTDANTGHNVQATVYMGTGTMWRRDGPEELKPLGEVEFATGISAMSASGLYGPIHVGVGIVGLADLGMGRSVKKLLTSMKRAGGERFKGVWHMGEIDPVNETLIEGVRLAGEMGLSTDFFVPDFQIPLVEEIAAACPDSQIILQHAGTPLGANSMWGDFSGQRNERFTLWRNNMRSLARHNNVVVGMGGLAAMPWCGFTTFEARPAASSEQLSSEWKPYIETTIELFGADRCMFESDSPYSFASCDYRTLWNAYKRAASGASAEEKSALFFGTANRVYKLNR